MGSGYVIKCKECDFRYEAMLGIGMLFPNEYAETVEDIKIGLYGEEYKRFFEENNNAAVNCENEIAICTQCGKLDTIKNLSLYLPKEETAQTADYVMPDDLKSDYKKIQDYNHLCSCGGDMRIIKFPDELFDGKINCPECGEKLMLDPMDMIMWD